VVKKGSSIENKEKSRVEPYKEARAGVRKQWSSKKEIALRAATSKINLRNRATQTRNEDDGFGQWVGLWEARKERIRMNRCAAVRFGAVNPPRELLGDVVCRAPPATPIAVPDFLAQSTHLEPEAVWEVEVGVSAVAVVLALAFEKWYFERLR
jgi:hypothetical protein